MDKFYKSKTLIILICIFIFAFGLFNFLKYPYTIKINKNRSYYNLTFNNEEEFKVYVYGAVEFQGEFKILESTSFLQLFNMCEVSDQAELNSFCLSDKVINSKSHIFIIKHKLLKNPIEINTAANYEMLAAGLDASVIIKLLQERENKLLNRDTLVKDKILTREEFDKNKYLMYSIN